MKRYQLFEFEDLPWYPEALRDYTTDFLQFMVARFDMYRGLVPLVKQGLAASGTNEVLDIASGGGGGWPSLVAYLEDEGQDVRVTLSDRYPNEKAFEALALQTGGVITGISTPLDALSVPSNYRGLRTQFLAFHHFPPAQARELLQNAVNDGVPLLVVEIQDRSMGDLCKHMISPLSVLLTTPFIRPFRWGRLVFTYLLPILPLVIWWDGLVSVLRTYRSDEIHAMVDSLRNADDYAWEMGVCQSGMAQLRYLAGYPKGKGSSQD